MGIIISDCAKRDNVSVKDLYTGGAGIFEKWLKKEEQIKKIPATNLHHVYCVCLFWY